MKKSGQGNNANKNRNINTLKSKAPVKHDDPQRLQPPTPQDIARVQPKSQTQHGDHPGNLTKDKSGKK